MAKVYFKAIDSYEKTKEINEASKALLERMVEEEGISLNPFIPMKVHFGEAGNVTYIEPKNYEGIYSFLEEKGVDSAYIETNVLYKGERTTSESHKKLAKEHGFTKYPVIIADGDHGENYVEVDINKTNFKSCKIGGEFMKYDQMLVAAHLKGHVLAGFGGAVKQLAMGCASRGGKLAQHDNSKLVVKENRCTKCGACAKQCPANAISFHPHAVIDAEKCIGCASCMVACKFNAIRNPWDGVTTENFHERLAEYAYGAARGKKNLYINFVFNITENCDCEGHKMKMIGKDTGVLVSTDPVAIDQASLDQLHKASGKTIFTVGLRTLEYAEEIGLGSRAYELIEM